ncbi:PAS domain-containing protein [Polycladidibacter hongkongensis]|uniref:PAS domain-containing protein n=1 Tax=Polycladidibacter hongkongensis TaxID=1647556 RepID=UPI00082FE23C|nr:PAS domain-containing protein [Pseudovibrio hongkongensis]
MKHGATRLLYSYWDEIRATREAPERCDIQPAAIKSVLGDTFILEYKKPAAFIYRLAGTRVCALYGRELKSRDFFDGWQDADKAKLTTMLESVTKEKAAAVLTLSAVSASGDSLPLELLLLPVNVRGQGAVRILGSLVPMQRAHWIGADPVIAQKVSSMRVLWPDEIEDFAGFSSQFQRETNLTIPRQPTNLKPPHVDMQNSSAFGKARQVKHLLILDGGKA